jgi:AbiV family abortive infection protein
MIKFLNLSPIQSKGLDKPIYKNALNLKKDAILLAEQRKSYSAATSLLVLSTEEAVKSTLVLLHSEGYNIYKVKDSRKFFSDHVLRHQIAMLIEMGLSFYESWYKFDQRKPTKLVRTKKTWFNNLVNGAIDVIKAADPIINSERNINYLQEFNTIKNKGFYVDYRDGLIDPNIEITLKDYTKALNIASRIFKFNKLLKILFHDKLENHMEKEKVEKAKNYIREFINDGMKLVSFDELKKKSL